MPSLQGFVDEPDIWRAFGANAILKAASEELFPAQRDDDFLLSSNQDHVAVFNTLDRNLMNSAADLQPELLAFAHYSAVDDGVTTFWIENNTGNDEC